jgi:MFS family permease
MRKTVLANRNMRVLLAGQTMNMFGNTAMVIVLGIWVKNLTGSSGAAGLIFLLLAATAFLAPATGLLVDRFPRRAVLVINDTVAALSMALLLLVHDRHGVWLIYLVTGIYGITGQIYRAARGGLLHSMVPDELLGEANGLFSSLSQGMKIIGPLVGAAVYAAWGGGVVALADIGTFVFSISSYLALRRVRDLARRRADAEQERQFGRELTAGIRHVLANPVIRRLIVASTVGFTGAGMIDVAMFSLVDQGLHRPTALIGVVTSIEGAGSVIAGLTVGPMMRRMGEYSVACIGFLLNGAGLAAASTATLAGVIGGSVLIGIGLPMALVAELNVVQRRTPAELQGRAIAASEAIINTPFAIAIAVGAGLIGIVGFRPIYIGVAAGFTVAGLALLPYLGDTWPSGAPGAPVAPAAPAEAAEAAEVAEAVELAAPAAVQADAVLPAPPPA